MKLKLCMTLWLVISAQLAWGQGVTVVPASEEVRQQAASKVAVAIGASSVEPFIRLLDPPVLCGPRLWQELKKKVPDDKNRFGTAMLIYDPASGKESWGIRALAMATLKEDTRKVVETLAKTQPGRIPVETGVFRGTGRELLAQLLRAGYLEQPVSVVQASPSDLGYYWLLIPYDIEEPVLRVDTAHGSLLLDVAEDGMISWIDLLPEDIVRVDRRDSPESVPPN